MLAMTNVAHEKEDSSTSVFQFIKVASVNPDIAQTSSQGASTANM